MEEFETLAEKINYMLQEQFEALTNDVYGEDLQAVFEDIYDNYINVRNDGFINI